MNMKEKDRNWSCVQDNPGCILKVEGGQACVNSILAGACRRRVHGAVSDLRIIYFKKRLAAAAATA